MESKRVKKAVLALETHHGSSAPARAKRLFQATMPESAWSCSCGAANPPRATECNKCGDSRTGRRGVSQSRNQVQRNTRNWGRGGDSRDREQGRRNNYGNNYSNNYGNSGGKGYGQRKQTPPRSSWRPWRNNTPWQQGSKAREGSYRSDRPGSRRQSGNRRQSRSDSRQREEEEYAEAEEEVQKSTPAIVTFTSSAKSVPTMKERNKINVEIKQEVVEQKVTKEMRQMVKKIRETYEKSGEEIPEDVIKLIKEHEEERTTSQLTYDAKTLNIVCQKLQDVRGAKKQQQQQLWEEFQSEINEIVEKEEIKYDDAMKTLKTQEEELLEKEEKCITNIKKFAEKQEAPVIDVLDSDEEEKMPMETEGPEAEGKSKEEEELNAMRSKQQRELQELREKQQRELDKAKQRKAVEELRIAAEKAKAANKAAAAAEAAEAGKGPAASTKAEEDRSRMQQRAASHRGRSKSQRREEQGKQEERSRSPSQRKSKVVKEEEEDELQRAETTPPFRTPATSTSPRISGRRGTSPSFRSEGSGSEE